jgi:hypothetical protein
MRTNLADSMSFDDSPRDMISDMSMAFPHQFFPCESVNCYRWVLARWQRHHFGARSGRSVRRALVCEVDSVSVGSRRHLSGLGLHRRERGWCATTRGCASSPTSREGRTQPGSCLAQCCRSKFRMVLAMDQALAPRLPLVTFPSSRTRESARGSGAPRATRHGLAVAPRLSRRCAVAN